MRRRFQQPPQRTTEDRGDRAPVDLAPGEPPLLVPVRRAGSEAVAVIGQIRAVSKQRLERRVGELSQEHMEEVERALCEVLEIG